MAPKKRKVESSVKHKTRATLVVEEATMHCQFDVNPTDKETMSILEEEVRTVRAYTEDEVVDRLILIHS
jgi:hypothetical protein